MGALTVRSVVARLGWQVDDRPLRRFAAETDKAKRGLEGVDREAKAANKSLMSLATDGLAKFDLVSNAIGKLVAPLREVVSTGAKYEQLRAALTTVEGSADKAAESFGRLQKFAASTPFQLEELTEGFIKLKAQGLDTSDRALRAWGDTASSMGKTFDQMVEAVSDASRGEFERLKEFGIVAKKEGDKATFLFKGVRTEVANNSEAIQGYLRGLAETNFAGGMERQSATLSGLWSTLKDNVAAAADELFRAGLGDLLKDWVKEAIEAAKATGQWIAKNKDLIKTKVGDFLGNLRDTAKTLWPLIETLAKVALGLADGLNKVGVGIGPVLVGLASLRTAIIAATGPWGALAAAAIAAGVAIVNAMADAEKRTESLGRAAARVGRQATFGASLEGKSSGELRRMKDDLEREKKASKTIREDVRGLSPAAIKKLERERQLDVEAIAKKEAALDEALNAAEEREVAARKEYSDKKAAEKAAEDASYQQVADEEELRYLRKKAKKGQLSREEVDRKKELEKSVGAYVAKPTGGGRKKKPKEEKSLLDLVTGSAPGGGTAAAARGLGTTIINLDARSTIQVEVVAPEGLVGETSTTARAVAENAGQSIGRALAEYFDDHAKRVARVFEG